MEAVGDAEQLVLWAGVAASKAKQAIRGVSPSTCGSASRPSTRPALRVEMVVESDGEEEEAPAPAKQPVVRAFPFRRPAACHASPAQPSLLADAMHC